MVKYKSGDIDPENLEPGRWYARTFTGVRGGGKNKTEYVVLQVRKKNVDGVERHYWHRVKDSSLVNGQPPQLSARLLGKVPTQEHIDLYEAGNNVYLHTAKDNKGENPTSHLKLSKRKNGNESVYHWSTVKASSEAAPSSSSAKSSPKKKPKKAKNKSAAAKKAAKK